MGKGHLLEYFPFALCVWKIWFHIFRCSAPLHSGTGQGRLLFRCFGAAGLGHSVVEPEGREEERGEELAIGEPGGV